MKEGEQLPQFSFRNNKKGLNKSLLMIQETKKVKGRKEQKKEKEKILLFVIFSAVAFGVLTLF